MAGESFPAPADQSEVKIRPQRGRLWVKPRGHGLPDVVYSICVQSSGFGATPFGLPTSLFKLRRDKTTPQAGFSVQAKTSFAVFCEIIAPLTFET